jgi:prophage antirepressor-like protein
MNADLTPFDFQGTPVRVVLIDGDPWFVLADACRVLGIANPSDVVKRLRTDGVGTSDPIPDRLGRTQQATIINESNLYRLVLRANSSPTSDTFQDWVTGEVLPTIRRTGSYGVTDLLKLPTSQILSLTVEAAHRAEIAEQELARVAPMVDAYEALMSADGFYSMEAAAKVLFDLTGLGRNRLFAWLRERGVLMSTNLPYQAYVERGWFKVTVSTWTDPRGDTHPTYTTRVTGKGVDGIRSLWQNDDDSNRPTSLLSSWGSA